MKTLLFTALALTQVTAFASRTPETYCESEDGSIKMSIFNDTARERETDLTKFNGQGYEKISSSSVMRKDTNGEVIYLASDFSLVVAVNKAYIDGVEGKLKYVSAASSELAEETLVCRLIK